MNDSLPDDVSLLRIYCFGRMRVLRGGTAIEKDAWRTQKNKALFKLLLTHRDHALTQEQLIEWLWRDLSIHAARRNLRVAVSQLRRTLEPGLPRGAASRFVLTVPGGYAWCKEAHYWLDVEEFDLRCGRIETSSPTWEDIEAQVRNAERARALYRGDFLVEDRYAEWALAERERLRERFYALLTRLAELYARQGRYRRAVALCQETLREDSCRESVWRQLMLYHFHAGDRAQALLAYEQCVAALAQELGVAPLPETTSLMEQIHNRPLMPRSGAGSASRREASLATFVDYPPPAAIERLRNLPLSLGHTPFVGRDEEYVWLLAQMRRASTQGGRIVLIEGEAGMGKSRLAAEMLDYTRGMDVVVLESACRESENAIPFQPLTEALHRVLLTSGLSRIPNAPPASPSLWLAWLGDLLPELHLAFPSLPPTPRLASERERELLFEGLGRLLLLLSRPDLTAAPKPMLLYIDDMHRADAGTIAFFHYLLPLLRHYPWLALISARTEAFSSTSPLAGLLWAARRQGRLRRLSLKPWTHAHIIEFLQEAAGAPVADSVLARWLFEQSEGNPLFALSALQTLFEEGAVVVNEGGVWSLHASSWGADAISSTPTIAALIRRRLEKLDAQERQVLEAASVLGREFALNALVQMRLWRPDALLDHLERLVAHLFLQECGHDAYRFIHEQIRYAVYERIGDERRRWLHRKAAYALVRLTEDRLEERAEALSRHFEKAGLVSQALTHRLVAARRAEKLHAIEEALAHYEQALALARESTRTIARETWLEIYEHMADILRNMGKYTQAQKQLEQALEMAATPTDVVRTLYKLAHSHARLGATAQARSIMRQAMEMVTRTDATIIGLLQAASVYARWSILGAPELTREQSLENAEEALRLLKRWQNQQPGSSSSHSWADYQAVHTIWINAGVTFAYWDDWRRAERLFERALEIAKTYEDMEGMAYSYLNSGETRFQAGDFAAARAFYEQAARLWKQTGHRWLSMVAYIYLGRAWACEGRWDEARVNMERARAIGENMETTWPLAEVYLWLALLSFYQDEGGRHGHRHYQRARAVEDPGELTVLAGLEQCYLGLNARRAGRTAEAETHFAQAEAHWEGWSESRPYIRWLLPRLTA